jgi:CubicO group peptidase (beta-lactamase class C family)
MSQFFCSTRNNSVSLLRSIATALQSRTLYRTSIFSLLIILTSCGSSSQKKQELPGKNTVKILLTEPTPLPGSELQRLRDAAAAWYDSALRNRGFNGGMIVAKNGNIIFEVYNGHAHVGSTDSLTDTSSLHIASVSKTFTAMAILKLWQDGKISIDDEVSKYLQGFNYPGVTIRTLLNHRSGLPNYVYFMEDLGWDKKTFVTNADVLHALINRKAEIKNIGLPNVGFTYCNTNYALLALLIEKTTGKKYSDYLQETFFTPLGMKHTFVYEMSQAETVIPSYDYRGGLIPLNFLDVVYGDKNIYSTPKDLLTWDRALTSGILFNEKTLAEAYTPYSNEKPGIRNYGLGWRMNNYPTGKKMIYHNGWWHGNNASFIRLLEDSATIIVLGNKYNRGIYHANKLSNIFGHYLGNGEEEEREAATRPARIIPKKTAVKKRSQAVSRKKAVSTTPVKKKTNRR